MAQPAAKRGTKEAMGAASSPPAVVAMAVETTAVAALVELGKHEATARRDQRVPVYAERRNGERRRAS